MVTAVYMVTRLQYFRRFKGLRHPRRSHTLQVSLTRPLLVGVTLFSLKNVHRKGLHNFPTSWQFSKRCEFSTDYAE